MTIYVEMYGRLGNQMFRYAIARKLQSEFYPDEKLCFNFSNISGSQTNDGSFKDELVNFNTVSYDTYDLKGKVMVNETNLKQKFAFAVARSIIPTYNPKNMNKIQTKLNKVYPLLNKNGIYWSWCGYQKPLRSFMKNKIVSGNFESPLYFSGIKEILTEEFEPRLKLLKHNIKLFDKIQNSNSVCISVRRGDFVGDNTIAKIHNVVNERYFNKAISVMKTKVNNPTFIIFSDDVEWAKKHLKFGDCTFYSEKGDDPVWEKMRLMYSCKHFIISNSTFSWWAQYLGRHKDKIVISPTKWFNNSFCSPLIQESFIKVS